MRAASGKSGLQDVRNPRRRRESVPLMIAANYRVVNVQVLVDASGFPATSFTPPAPPITLEVNVLVDPSGEVGVKVAIVPVLSSVTVPATT